MAIRTSRANSRELKKIKAFLIARDGLKCAICNHEAKEKDLIVEHKDNNPFNWDPKNLQLAHQSCNIKKNPPYRNRKHIDFESITVNESVTQIEDEPKPMSAEMFRNLKSEPVFRNWLKKEMTSKLVMEVTDIISSGAEIAQVSVQTAQRYLIKLTSRLGPYNVTFNENETKIIEWKKKYFPYNAHINKFTK